jgi:hypothetical protein
LDYSGVIGRNLEERCNKFVEMVKADERGLFIAANVMAHRNPQIAKRLKTA